MIETHLHVRNFDSPLSKEAFAKVPRMPVYTILDNLRSAFNVGSIVRTADSALMDTIYMCGYTAAPPHKKLEKTALGSLEYVPCQHRMTPMDAVEELKSRNIPIYAFETTNRSKNIWEVAFPMPIALVLGNEALGISRDVLAEADELVEIPMFGYKNSINVAVAFGIISAEIQRQHWDKYPHDIRIALNQNVNQSEE